jgi:hypothetical protein
LESSSPRDEANGDCSGDRGDDDDGGGGGGGDGDVRGWKVRPLESRQPRGNMQAERRLRKGGIYVGAGLYVGRGKVFMGVEFQGCCAN